MDCPKCGNKMKVHYAFWVDPMVECTNVNCSMSDHKHRVSELKKEEHSDKSLPVS